MRTETLINHPRLRVQLCAGTEGPRHDPYSYRELHVRTPQGKTVLHEGLGVWLKHNDKNIEPPKIKGFDGDGSRHDRAVRMMFSELVGYTPTQLNRIAERIHSRCTRCGGRNFKTADGYPGETFLVCVDCWHVNAASMDFSAIE